MREVPVKPALRSAVMTERFGTVGEGVTAPEPAGPTVVARRPVAVGGIEPPLAGDPTERYGTIPGPEIVPDDEPSTANAGGDERAFADRAPSKSGSVRPGRVEGRRERKLLRAVIRGVEIEPSSSSKATELDLPVVRRFDPTLRLRAARTPVSPALILIGAGALSLAVLAAGMLARELASPQETTPAATPLVP